MLRVTVIYCFNCGYTSIISGLSIDLLYNPYKDGFNKATDNIPEDF